MKSTAMEMNIVNFPAPATVLPEAPVPPVIEQAAEAEAAAPAPTEQAPKPTICWSAIIADRQILEGWMLSFDENGIPNLVVGDRRIRLARHNPARYRKTTVDEITYGLVLRGGINMIQPEGKTTEFPVMTSEVVDGDYAIVHVDATVELPEGAQRFMSAFIAERIVCVSNGEALVGVAENTPVRVFLEDGSNWEIVYENGSLGLDQVPFIEAMRNRLEWLNVQIGETLAMDDERRFKRLNRFIHEVVNVLELLGQRSSKVNTVPDMIDVAQWLVHLQRRRLLSRSVRERLQAVGKKCPPRVQSMLPAPYTVDRDDVEEVQETEEQRRARAERLAKRQANVKARADNNRARAMSAGSGGGKNKKNK